MKVKLSHFPRGPARLEVNGLSHGHSCHHSRGYNMTSFVLQARLQGMGVEGGCWLAGGGHPLTTTHQVCDPRKEDEGRRTRENVLAWYPPNLTSNSGLLPTFVPLPTTDGGWWVWPGGGSWHYPQVPRGTGKCVAPPPSPQFLTRMLQLDSTQI